MNASTSHFSSLLIVIFSYPYKAKLHTYAFRQHFRISMSMLLVNNFLFLESCFLCSWFATPHIVFCYCLFPLYCPNSKLIFLVYKIYIVWVPRIWGDSMQPFIDYSSIVCFTNVIILVIYFILCSKIISSIFIIQGTWNILSFPAILSAIMYYW